MNPSQDTTAQKQSAISNNNRQMCLFDGARFAQSALIPNVFRCMRKVWVQPAYTINDVTTYELEIPGIGLKMRIVQSDYLTFCSQL